jgi:hypothetical protein
MKIRAIIALSFGIASIGASLPAVAESTSTDRSIPKIKVESIERRRTTEPKVKTCNIQCITTPCPCTIESDPNSNKPQNRPNKYDRR